ncbi:MAG: nucleotidyltransferase family protein [Muribaculum sp.]|nr:nucleotidyltransferase family protein [Muribaculaceae bacterium]MCM1080948.1 nucleotidyltransferase family protein [Muribaculum sp.]
MKAMIFAAGMGTRLRPETNTKPKALVEVAGKPMLRHVIEHLIAAGADTIIVNVHHFSEMICEYLESNNRFGVNIIVSDESEKLLDTGGGIVKAAPLLADSEPILVHNADILSNVDLHKLYEWHINSGASATLLVDNQRKSSRRLLFDNGMKMHGWVNTLTGATRPFGMDLSKLEMVSFGGIHVISQEMLSDITTYKKIDDPFSITDYYIDQCGTFDIRGYQIPDGHNWFDIGSPEKLTNARIFYKD